MWLEHIGIQHCRRILQQDLSLATGMNVFVGTNGSGKSSFVEALCILSRGRSFRTQRLAEVISQGAEALTVTGRLRTESAALSYPLGITKARDGSSRIRINHADSPQQAELTRHLPLTVMHPDSVNVLSGSPTERRALLDWIAFYRDAEFHMYWRNYQRVLKQRNACLRDARQHSSLAYWTEQWLLLQPRLYHFRSEAVQALVQALEQVRPLLEPLGQVGLRLHSGFPGQLEMDVEALAAFFQERKEQELRQGLTLYGAHRGDLLVTVEGEPALRQVSRGQLKLLSIALLLAQSAAITHDSAKRGIIAVDDLASELDEHNQRLLFQVLGQTGQQLVITGTRQPPLAFLPADARLFHVEQGQIRLTDS